MKKIYFFLVMLFAVNGVWGQLLFNDDFSYSGNLNANGWTVHSGAATNVIATTTGLTYTGLVGSGVGNAALVNNLAGEDVNKTFTNQNTNGQVIYYSALINVTDPAATKSGDYFLHIGTPGGATFTNFAARVFVRITASGVNFGINNINTAVFGTTNFSKNTTYLLIVKYTINTAGNDAASLWIIPSGVPATEAAAGTAENTTASLGQDQINAIALRQGATSISVQVVVDALKVGLTWADVAPVAGTPSLGVAPSSLPFVPQAVGTQSASQFFNLSGSNLTGAPGNITVNSPSTDFQVSNDNSSWGASTTIAYASATLSATPVYVRFTPLTGGPKSGNVTFSGGGVGVPPTVALTGTGTKTFYSKSTGTLTNISDWGDVSNGSGTAPLDFTTDGQVFIIANRATETLDANWTVSGAGSKVVVGDGSGGIDFTIPAGFFLAGTVDVANNGDLIMENPTLPTIGTLSTGSQVVFAQPGTYVLPARAYHNLVLKNGTKTLAAGTTTVTGQFRVDGVTGFNGAGSPFSTLDLSGGLFQLTNGATFDPNPAGDGNRLTLIASASLTTLTGGNFELFRLQTPATPIGGKIVQVDGGGAGNSLFLGNSSSGGLNLQQSTDELWMLPTSTLTIRASGFFSSTNLGTIHLASNSNLVIDKTSGSIAIGSIGFTAGARTLNNFTYNSAGTGNNNLTLLTDVVVGGNLTLTNGNLNTTGVNLLTYTGAGAGGGGSTASHVNGPMARTGSTDYQFPIGNATLYRPISVSSLSGSATITASYTQGNPKTAFGTALAAGIDHIGVCEYWDLDDGASTETGIVGLQFGGSCNANAYINDPATLLVAHWNGSQWDNLGTDGSATSTTVKALISSTFSPFTIGSSSNLTNPLPVSLYSFSGYKDGSRNQLRWTTAGESNNRGFEVQRSTDGINYSSLGVVNTQALGGNSTAQLNYAFTDNNVIGSKQYYRLRQVNFDGNSKLSNIILIKGDKPVTLMIDGLFPNPASTLVNVLIAAPNKDKITLVVTDIAGRTVMQQLANVETGSNTIPVDISRLANGTYMVKLVCSSNCETAVGKFVKQ